MSEDELVPLAPLPADVAATIGGIALSPWPTTLEELSSAYSGLGITVGDALEPDGSGLTTYVLVSPEGVPAFAQFFSDEFIGVSFFAWDSLTANFADTIRGFDELRAQLERRFGAGTVSELEPRDVSWTLGVATIGLQAFTTRDSIVQVGVEHTARSAAFSAASR